VIAAPALDLDLLSWIAPTAERHLNIVPAISFYMVRSSKTDQHVLLGPQAALRASETDFDF
jgi:hypothetical protein